MENLIRYARMLGDTERSWRDDKFNDTVKKYMVDTCYTPDTEKWETGVKVKGTWVIVDKYENRNKAKLGHIKWVKECKKTKPNIKEGKDCSAEDWFYN